MEVDVTRALEEMIGLPDVVFLELEIGSSGDLLVHVELGVPGPSVSTAGSPRG